MPTAQLGPRPRVGGQSEAAPPQVPKAAGLPPGVGCAPSGTSSPNSQQPGHMQLVLKIRLKPHPRPAVWPGGAVPKQDAVGRVQPRAGQRARLRPTLGSSGAQLWRRRGCQRPAERSTDRTLPGSWSGDRLPWGGGGLPFFLRELPSNREASAARPGRSKRRLSPPQVAPAAAAGMGATGSEPLQRVAERHGHWGVANHLACLSGSPRAVGSFCPPPPPLTLQGPCADRALCLFTGPLPSSQCSPQPPGRDGLLS